MNAAIQSLGDSMKEDNDIAMIMDAYANQIVENMDMKTMEQFVFDTIQENLQSYSKEELITEITESYGEEWLEENGFSK